MCGIVGLFLKNERYEARLGEFTAAMLATMSARGPDSAGFAVYGVPAEGLKLTLRGATAAALVGVVEGLERAYDRKFSCAWRDTHCVLSVPQQRETAIRARLKADHPDIDIVSSGRRIEVYKEVGLPESVAERFALPSMQGTHAIGHTRMATESKVTTNGAHPFTTGPDQCLVHNGSLSNHNGLRRELRRDGLQFSTENDTEVAAAYLSWQIAKGSSLKGALERSIEDLDGFFTFVVGTENGFAVVRDPIACKPAVMAESDDYVAFGSEYRALVSLPAIESAHVFEPEPARVYSWERH